MTQRVLAFLLTATLFLSACKEETILVNGISNNPPGSFTFKVDGTAVTIDSARAVLYNLGIPPNNREIDVYAFQGGNQVLEFHFLPRTGAKTAAQNFTGAWLTYKTAGTSYHSQSGTLNLTVSDTTGGRFEATFNFVGNSGTATKNITEGTMVVTRMTRQ